MGHFEQIGASLGIRQSTGETQYNYQKRILISLVSDWMQTDVFSGGYETSIKHVKQIGLEKVHFIKEMLPDALPYDEHELIEYIYDTLIANGIFLHRDYNVRSAPHRLIGDDNYAIVRGMYPEELVSFSGLCPYTNQSGTSSNIADSFALPSIPLEKIVNMVWNRSIPTPSGTHIDEYIDTNRKPRSAYYRSYISDSSGMIFGRIRRLDFHYDYYLIVDDDIRRIPEDYVSVSLHEYARLYLMEQKQVQTVMAILDKDNTVELEFSYHLPQPDLRFLRYIAWPDNDKNLNDAWSFTLQQELWPMLKERLLFLNYKVVEKYA